MTAFLERLTPHLERAAQLQAQRYVFSTDALVGHAFVNRSRQPVILTSTEGELLRHNEPAQHLLQSTSLVRIAGRRIVLPEPFYSRFLEDCAETERRVRSGAPGAYEDAAHYRVMRIPGEAALPARRQGHSGMASAGGTEAANGGSSTAEPGAGSTDMLYVFYNLIVPGEVSATFGLRTIAMLIFYHPRSAPPVDEDLLAAAFDLTPAESRIAHLLADGLTPKDIAARVGVQPDTVRKQMQSIYQKTGTNRQPDLVRLLLHLPGGSAVGYVQAARDWKL
ncbi:helix-turn-helix transcriptional regulator [Paraburkholderia kururiensis]|uniref:Helix-turn-helix transcriptional regulator n=1 Tax=Paraburkholderia kururiensis TaxID=984307 RepID=A0ABZ0WNN2_9BURK|nr:helix-turn-helix transcriptional regulator [Paraburkholderia kururiensis]WQD78903.1 helix-turn-helix transcriptional regulator [Paraburkholderia kururiensis]